MKNTGRCRELLIPSATVYLERSDATERKTKYDLIAVEKETDQGTLFINMDSQIPNGVVYEWLSAGNLFSEKAKIRREVFFGDSRFDLFVQEGEKKSFIEVKGVTLERDGIAMFPDAPTKRGCKHIHELIRAAKEGFDAYLIFVIQMKGVSAFVPNGETDPDFAAALLEAKQSGVKILAYDCLVEPQSIILDGAVPILI